MFYLNPQFLEIDKKRKAEIQNEDESKLVILKNCKIIFFQMLEFKVLISL